MKALAAILMFLASPAASANCADRGQVIGRLQTKFHEVQSGAGLQSQQTIIEVWYSPDTRTWTILASGTNGISCILASGTNWYPIEVKAGVPG